MDKKVLASLKKDIKLDTKLLKKERTEGKQPSKMSDTEVGYRLGKADKHFFLGRHKGQPWTERGASNKKIGRLERERAKQGRDPSAVMDAWRKAR